MPAVLTNWDEGGCFLYFPVKTKLPKNISIQLEIEGDIFTDSGQICSVIGKGAGHGVKFKNNHGQQQSWREFYGLISDMGYIPGES